MSPEPDAPPSLEELDGALAAMADGLRPTSPDPRAGVRRRVRRRRARRGAFGLALGGVVALGALWMAGGDEQARRVEVITPPPTPTIDPVPGTTSTTLPGAPTIPDPGTVIEGGITVDQLDPALLPLAALTDDGRLVVVEAEATGDVAVIEWHAGPVQDFAVALDGTFWVAVGEGCAPEIGQVIAPGELVLGPVAGRAPVLSADGRRFAYADHDPSRACERSTLMTLTDWPDIDQLTRHDLAPADLDDTPFLTVPVGWLADGSLAYNVYQGDTLTGWVLAPDGSATAIEAAPDVAASLDEQFPTHWSLYVAAVVDGDAIVVPWSYDHADPVPHPHLVVDGGVAVQPWRWGPVPAGLVVDELSARGVISHRVLGSDAGTVVVGLTPVIGVRTLRFVPEPGAAPLPPVTLDELDPALLPVAALTDGGELVVVDVDGRPVVWETGVVAFEPADDGTFWVTVGEGCAHELWHSVGPFEVAERLSGGFGHLDADGMWLAYSDADCNPSRLTIRDLSAGSVIHRDPAPDPSPDDGSPYQANPVGWLADGRVAVNAFHGDGVWGQLVGPDGGRRSIELSPAQVARFDVAIPQGWGCSSPG